MRQQLLRVPDVNKVELFGVQDEKLYIEISQRRLAQLGLDMNQVLAQLGQQNAVEGAGTLQTPLDVLQVRVAGQFTAVEQLAAMPIRGSSGNQMRLGDIAEIRRDYVDPASVKVRHQGRRVRRWRPPLRASVPGCQPGSDWSTCKTSPMRSPSRSTSLSRC